LSKVVDKPKKRDDIAQSATALFLEKGYSNLTISEIAKNAGVAKGSIYKYFESKEDIVFGIIEQAQESYDKEILYSIQNTNKIEDKILALFDLCISNCDEGIKRRKIYKEFISICLDDPSEKMVDFLYNIKEKYTNWLKDILREGILSGKLKPQSLEFANGLFVIGEGVLLFSPLVNYNDENLLQLHIKSLLKLIKIGENDE
jgi:AcrR family transcriptional regulator